MSSNDKPMFKMLFRDRLYTLDDVMRSAEQNPDILWVVYEVKAGGRDINRRESLGTMTASTIMSKFG